MKASSVFAVIAALLLPILIYIVKVGSSYLRARIAASEDEQAKNLFESVLRIIEIAVSAVEQTFVLPAKAGDEWTPLTDGEAANAKAKEIIDKLLTEQQKAALTAKCGDYGEYINAAIERTCLAIKGGAAK